MAHPVYDSTGQEDVIRRPARNREREERREEEREWSLEKNRKIMSREGEKRKKGGREIMEES